MCFSLLFFFFKQKTAYEMRISDWSSDVCSSDLLVEEGRVADDGGADAADGPEARQCFVGHVEAPGEGERGADAARLRLPFRRAAEPRQQALHARVVDGDQFANRSEEHTSELQSLMRISYAVFCLQKNK